MGSPPPQVVEDFGITPEPDLEPDIVTEGLDEEGRVEK